MKRVNDLDILKLFGDIAGGSSDEEQSWRLESDAEVDEELVCVCVCVCLSYSRKS